VAYESAHTERFLAEQRAHGYDVAIQMHGSGQASNPFVLALGARVTAGYYIGERPAGLTVGAPWPREAHEIPRVLGLARLLGCPDRGTHLELPLLTEDRSEAHTLLHGRLRLDRPWVGLHPGAAAPARRWPAERYAAVGDALARRYGARIALTGGSGEEDVAAAVEARLAAPCVNLAGRTSVGGLAAVIAALDLFICNDTGPAHVAAAVDTPSITIFGPGDPRGWAPLDGARHPSVRHPVPCSPCLLRECPIDLRCLNGIAPERVLAVAGELLALGVVACGA
jgi:ADP-heptose:LPS heptosyltransferase